jgi:hypothetical protein
LCLWIIFGDPHEKAHTPHSLGLLCARRQRPRDDPTAEREYELPPSDADCHFNPPPSESRRLKGTVSRRKGRLFLLRCTSLQLALRVVSEYLVFRRY